MKSKYVFINEDEVHESMIVHFVMVGTSEREQRQASHVQVCAAGTSRNSSLLPTQVTY